jgi:ferredoxin-NADP reductase
MKIILKEKKKLFDDIYEFNFKSDDIVNWIPGQFLQYYIDCKDDGRGTDRFFTIASSPLEGIIKLTTRFSSKGSSFKKVLKGIKIGTSLNVEGPWGKFTLIDSYITKKIFFISGGVGITPFRSIIQDLYLKKEKIDITLLYYNKTSEFIYKNEFDKNNAIKKSYIIGSVDKISLLENINVLDNQNSLYYISGPEGFVKTTESIFLNDLNIYKENLKSDFFPGYSKI